MEQPVLSQALIFLEALLHGTALGLFYDLLRIPRRLLGRGSGWFDLLFGLGLTWGTLYFLLGPGGGKLPLYAVAGMALGFWVWNGTLGRLIRPVLEAVFCLIGRIFRCLLSPVTKFFNFLRQLAKKYF